MAGTKSTAVAEYKLTGKMAEMMAMATELSKSRIVPASYAGNPAGIFAAVQYGKEMGLQPMTSLQNIAVINGKPSLGTDMFLGLCMRHPEWGGYEITESSEKSATIKVWRVNQKSKKTAEFKYTFTYEEAVKAGLVRAGGPWDKWKKRMLKHRATAFALRDAFPDVLAGTYTLEEMDPDVGAQREFAEVAAISVIDAEDLEEGRKPDSEPVLAPKKKATPKKGY